MVLEGGWLQGPKVTSFYHSAWTAGVNYVALIVSQMGPRERDLDHIILLLRPFGERNSFQGQ